MTRRTNQSGFTLVELLIVIVVLAILASISMVAYQGVVERAGRASVQARITQWDQLIKMYVADTGLRPQGQWACVGKIEDYPAEDGFPAGSCSVRTDDGGTTWYNQYSVDSEGNLMSDQLSNYISSKVVADHDVIELSRPLSPGVTRTVKYRGIVYDDLNLTNYNATFVYAVPGDSCLGPSFSTFVYNNGRVCTHNIMPVSGIGLSN